MWEILIVTAIATGGLIYINWGKLFPNKQQKTISLEQVIQEADSALQFDPLNDVKNRPEAVKPLLAALLAIREKKAEEELIAEERARISRKMFVDSYVDRHLSNHTHQGKQQAELMAQQAQQDMKQAEADITRINPKYQAIGYNALEGLEGSKNTAIGSAALLGGAAIAAAYQAFKISKRG